MGKRVKSAERQAVIDKVQAKKTLRRKQRKARNLELRGGDKTKRMRNA